MSLMSHSVGDRSSALLRTSIGSHFEDITNRYPDNLAIVVKHQDIRWSYRRYLEEIDKLATGLHLLGIQKGDRVGIWAPNCIEWCLTQFATARIGAILVCINPAYRTHELEFALRKAGCRALVTAERFKTSEYIEMIREVAAEINDQADPYSLNIPSLPELDMVIRLGEVHTPGMLNFDKVVTLGSDEAAQKEVERINASLDPHDPINIQFTSGTTGSPKGATLTHFNILNNAKMVADGMQLNHHDKLCVPVPLYHCFGMVLGNLTSLANGSAAIFPGASFDPVETLAAVDEEQCTALHGVPTMFIAELESSNFDSFNLSSLRTGIMAGAPCPEEVMRKVMDKMFMSEILIGYGQTELSPINCMTSTDDEIRHRVGSVGRVLSNLEIKIVDENNQIVARRSQGEICTKGYSVMKGYWGDDERTAETIDEEGWLHSGDLAVMDEEGYVKITGRIKDMIIRGGENVYPREIEEFLYSHPAIQDAHVFGIPDQRYGERVCVWAKLKDNHTLTEEQLKAFCKDKIAHFKIPEIVRFVEDFPMTVTGKVQKFEMRNQMLKNL